MKKLYPILLALFSVFQFSAQAQTARVQIIHNSPSPTVDIYANGALLLNDFAFRSATSFLDLPAGVSIDVAVAPASSTSAGDALVIFEGVWFEDGKTYQVIANGIVGDVARPFTLVINEMAREQATDPGKVDVVAFHGSPDAPAVDIDVRGAGNIVADLAFGEFSSYLSLDPGSYLLNIRPAGSPDLVATFRADLSGLAGKSATLFASGLLTSIPGFGLFAALADGTVVELPLNPVARLQIIHNSPSPTVDIYANGELLLDNFAFRTATPYIDVPAEVALDIAVAPENSTSADDALVVLEDVRLPNGATYTAIANGVVGNVQRPFSLVFNTNARERATDPEKVDIIAFHGSPDAPAVDADARTIGAIIENLTYGGFSPYLSLDPGVYYLDVRLAGTPSVLATFAADLSGLGGQAATLFASGFALGQPGFGLFAALADGTVVQLPVSPVARVQVIHNSPAPTVDVYANGELLLDDFAFRTATPFLFLPAGVDIDLAVAPANSTSADDALVTFEGVQFENGRTYVVTAGGVVGNTETPFTLMVNDMGREAADSDEEVAIAVLHGSPDAPAVDVDARGVGNLVADLAYGEYTGYLSVPAAEYLLDIRAAGDPGIVASFAADLSGLGGGAATVFASGFLGDTPAFGLFAALPDGAVVELPARQVARVQIIHNSPAPTVDIYANGELLLNDFAFRTATPFIDVPAGVNIDLAVAPANSTSAADALVTFEGVQFENGRTYVVTAGGVVGNTETPFTLMVNDMGREAADSDEEVAIAVLHGSPDAPAVDVDARGVGNLVANLAYGEYTGYLSVPAAEYLLDIRAAGDPGIVASFAADLSGLGGGAATVFASGFLGDTPAFGLFAALPDGAVVELPARQVARVQIIHNSPSPTVDIYANGELLVDDFAFRTATPFLFAPAGVAIDLAVAPASSTSAADALVTFEGVQFENGGAYVVIATGVVGNDDTPFTLNIFDTARESTASGVDLLLYHGSTDAPAVDVVVDGGGVLFDNVAYGDFQGYVNVPAGSYRLNITPADDNQTVVASYLADLSGAEGVAATVFASGFLGGDDPAFQVWVALPDGTTFPLPAAPSSIIGLEGKLNNMKLAPNPARDLVQLQYTLTEPLDLSLNIFDMNGRLVSSQIMGRQAPGQYTLPVDISRLARGMYTLSLVSPKGVATQRIVVQSR